MMGKEGRRGRCPVAVRSLGRSARGSVLSHPRPPQFQPY